MKLPNPIEILVTIGSSPNSSCTSCNLRFANTQDLYLHQLGTSFEAPNLSETECSTPELNENHQDRSGFECSECMKVFTSKKGRNQHIGKIHNFGKRSFKCQICLKKFREQSALKFHTRQVHEKSTRVPCHSCGEIFYSKHVMEKHKLNCVVDKLDDK